MRHFKVFFKNILSFYFLLVTLDFVSLHSECKKLSFL